MFFTAALAFYYQQDLYALCDGIKVNLDTPWILRLQTDLVATILQLVQTTYLMHVPVFLCSRQEIFDRSTKKKVAFYLSIYMI